MDKISKINNIIIQVLSERKLNTNVEISANSRLFEDLGIDSLGLALLTVLIEEEFNIDIFEDGIVSRVGEIYQKVNSL